MSMFEVSPFGKGVIAAGVVSGLLSAAKKGGQPDPNETGCVQGCLMMLGAMIFAPLFLAFCGWLLFC